VTPGYFKGVGMHLKNVPFLFISSEVGFRIAKTNWLTQFFIKCMGWSIEERTQDMDDPAQRYSMVVNEGYPESKRDTKTKIITIGDPAKKGVVQNIIDRVEESFASSPVFGVCVVNLYDWEVIISILKNYEKSMEKL
jgi:hypothetical protein